MRKGEQSHFRARNSADPSRRAFTLLEVLLATGLLLGCVIVLAELAAIGREHANAAEDLSTAQRLCLNRLNEILCGAMPLEAVDHEQIEEEEGNWTCSVTLEPAPQADLVAVRISIAREATPSRREREYSLVRWLAAPGLDSSSLGESRSSPAPEALP